MGKNTKELEKALDTSISPWDHTGILQSKQDHIGQRILNMVVAEIEYFDFIDSVPYFPFDKNARQKEYYATVLKFWDIKR